MRGAPRSAARTALIVPAALVVVALGLAAGCSDRDRAVAEALQAAFTPSDPSPAPMTLSLAPASAMNSVVEVAVRVTDIDQFFGAAFQVTFDPAVVEFLDAHADGSFIEADGIMTEIRAVPSPDGPGRLFVIATRQGQVAGVGAAGSQTLLSLLFNAVEPTAGTPIAFGDAATRLVITCPEPPDACTSVSDASLHWSGGTVTAN